MKEREIEIEKRERNVKRGLGGWVSRVIYCFLIIFSLALFDFEFLYTDFLFS